MDYKKTGLLTSATGFLASVATLILLGLGACTPQSVENPDDLEEEILTLSDSELEFANNGGSKDITVGGAETWNFISSEGENSWIKIQQDANTLSITVAPNPDGIKRSASILIFGKDAQAKVTVRQSAADFVLDFSESEINFPAAGGDKTILVSANSDEWSFDPVPEETEWLTMTGGKDVVTLNAKENTSTEAREAALTVTSATGEKRELTVRQSGKVKYFLPYLPAEDKLFSNNDLVYYEEARGNILVAYSEPQDFYGMIQPGKISFLSSSPSIALVDYITNDPLLLIYSEADLYIVFENAGDPVEEKEYVAFLKENGFKATDKEEKEFATENESVKATITTEGIADGMIVKFFPKERFAEQPGDMPTFKSIPGGLPGIFELIGDPSKNSDDVKAIEAKTDSKLFEERKDENDPTNTTYLSYTTAKGDKFTENLRAYVFKESQIIIDAGLDPDQIGMLNENHLYYYDISSAFWLNKNNPKMTREFQKLLDEEGYVYDSDVNNLWFYRKSLNDTQDHVLCVGAQQYTDLNGGSWTLIIAHYVWPKAEEYSLKANLNSLLSSKDFSNARSILTTPKSNQTRALRNAVISRLTD